MKKTSKEMNWSKILKKSKELEKKQDAYRAMELVEELYWLFSKHGCYDKKTDNKTPKTRIKVVQRKQKRLSRA